MHHKEILNEDLREGDIPPATATWEQIGEFALTFNGYDHWGSPEKCGEIAQQRLHDTVTNLRTCLFYEQRSWRFEGVAPSAKGMAYIRSLLEKIRQKVREDSPSGHRKPDATSGGSPRCFFLKMGVGNSLAKQWLSGDNPLGRPAAVIFFERSTIENIRQGRAGRQEIDFYRCSLPEYQKKTLIVVVGHGTVWILQPDGNLVEHDPSTPEEVAKDIWKMMPVKVLKKMPAKDVPPVLAGINASAYLNRGTFRELNNWGNIKALHVAAGRPIPAEQLLPENCQAPQLLECLSSVELETLVAKLFEEAGCFVAAYRGGCVQDVDLFVHNDGSEKICIDALTIAPGQRLAVQVKGWSPLKACPPEVDCLVGFEVPLAPPTCFNANWLLARVMEYPQVLAWLKRSLYWLPAEFLARFGL